MFAAKDGPHKVSRWMGHASLDVTDGINAHMYPSDYGTTVSKFEASYEAADG